MIKKIKLYFINRKIKKINREINNLHEELLWIKEHIYDMSNHESFTYIKAVNSRIKFYKAQLDSYNKYKEGLIK